VAKICRDKVRHCCVIFLAVKKKRKGTLVDVSHLKGTSTGNKRPDGSTNHEGSQIFSLPITKTPGGGGRHGVPTLVICYKERKLQVNRTQAEGGEREPDIEAEALENKEEIGDLSQKTKGECRISLNVGSKGKRKEGVEKTGKKLWNEGEKEGISTAPKSLRRKRNHISAVLMAQETGKARLCHVHGGEKRPQGTGRTEALRWDGNDKGGKKVIGNESSSVPKKELGLRHIFGTKWKKQWPPERKARQRGKWEGKPTRGRSLPLQKGEEGAGM